MEKEKVPEGRKEFTDEFETAIPVSKIETPAMLDPKALHPVYANWQWEAVAEVLNVLGRRNHTITQSKEILELCVIALEQCTFTGRDYRA